MGCPQLCQQLYRTGAGCENITDRYVDGFFWLNILGAVASTGFDRLHRQDIAGWSFTGGMSHYQLAGPPGWVEGSALMTPHPGTCYSFTATAFMRMIWGVARRLVHVGVVQDHDWGGRSKRHRCGGPEHYSSDFAVRLVFRLALVV
jgi:hypothetical protein